jgi:hypothetical protein
MNEATICPRFDAHRRRFLAARYRDALARVERAVLDRKWTAHRNARLDRALSEFEQAKGAA